MTPHAAPGGTNRSPRGFLPVWALGAAAFTVWALVRGQDANWDLQNYHDYGAYALLHRRFRLDVGPGSIQTWFNPLPYLPSYLLRHSLPPPLAAVAIAVLQALVVPLCRVLAAALAPPSGSARAALPALATLAGATGAMVLAEIGTSFADLLLAPLFLAALILLCRAADRPDDRARSGCLFAAGALFGAACGCKLTGLVFAPGLLAALLFPWPGSRGATFRAVAMVALGSLLGLLSTGGLWTGFLFVSLGNPVFPLFNDLFRSASAAPARFGDPRFLPHGLGDALRYPWAIARGEHPTAELPFADPRLLVSAPLCLLFLASRAVPRRVHLPADAVLARCCAFFLLSAAAWLAGFGIERYAVLIELLGGSLAVLLLHRLLPRRAALPAAVAATLLLCAATRPADWWHRPWSDPFRPLLPAALRRPAAYLLVSRPEGYWASVLPPASRFLVAEPIGLPTGGVLRARWLSVLRHPPGGRIRLLGSDAVPLEPGTRDELSALGLVPAAPCLRLRSLWDAPTLFCATAAPGPRPFAADDLPPDTPVDFSSRGDGWIFLGDGWGAPTPDGTPITAPAATLILHPVATATATGPARRQVLELVLSASVPTRVAVSAAPLSPLHPAPVRGSGTLVRVCLPADPGSGGTLRLLLRRDPGSATVTLRAMRLRPAVPGACPP